MRLSNTSSVVLPAFLPTVTNLAARLGDELLAPASAIDVGEHLVDVSRLSTQGALCMAAATRAATPATCSTS